MILNLEGNKVGAYPLILEDQGIDIILGVNWMKEHKVQIDVDNRIVSMRDTRGHPFKLQLPACPCLNVPSFFLTKSDGQPYSEILGRTKHLSSNS